MLRRRTVEASQQKKLSRWEATIAHNAQIDEPGDMLQPTGVAAPGFASASDLPACRDPAAAFRILCENGNSTDANQVHTEIYFLVHKSAIIHGACISIHCSEQMRVLQTVAARNTDGEVGAVGSTDGISRFHYSRRDIRPACYCG